MRAALSPLATLGALALAMLCAPADATPQRESLGALAGAWVFETEPQPVTNCVIRGNVEAVRAGQSLRMSMRVHETCPNSNEWRAEEACAAQLVRGVLSVRCTLVSATPDDYIADQFSLRVLSASLMTGRLNDGELWDGPVHWRRPPAALVS